MAEALENLVRRRANDLGEYCRFPEAFSEIRFVLDHVIARQHRGAPTADNLALACGFCNRHKGPNLSGVDPQNDSVVNLFHPRRDRWDEHFRWDGVRIIGFTGAGRATVEVLAMNHPDQVAIRLALFDGGLFPQALAGRPRT